MALPERVIPICLRGDLIPEMEDLDAQHTAAVQAEVSANDSRITGTPVSAELAERIAAVRAQMVEGTVKFRVRALPRRKWRDLVAAHPVREGNDDDRVVGFNNDTFFVPLLRGCLVDPVYDEAAFDKLVDEELSDRQFQDLANAAYGVCRGQVTVPFSPAVSSTT